MGALGPSNQLRARPRQGRGRTLSVMRDPHPLPGTDFVIDGRRVHVVRHGRGGRLPLLLLHGLPTSSYLWRDVMRDLERELPTIAPDLLGMGRSERPRVGGYDLPAQARRLLGLLDALHLERVAVAGHVLGGAVAVHLAALAPDRVAGLVLLGTPLHAETWPVPAVLPLTLPGLGWAYARAAGRMPALARRLLAGGLGATGVLPPEVLHRYTAPLLTPDGARGLVRFVQSVDLRTTSALWIGCGPRRRRPCSCGAPMTRCTPSPTGADWPTRCPPPAGCPSPGAVTCSPRSARSALPRSWPASSPSFEADWLQGKVRLSLSRPSSSGQRTAPAPLPRQGRRRRRGGPAPPGPGG